MFLYLKDFYLKKTFHVLLIIFCSSLLLFSIIRLIDLKNYYVEIDYSEKQILHHVESLGENKKLTLYRPVVAVKYKYDSMPYKFTFLNTRILDKKFTIQNYTLECKVYSGSTEDKLIDKFIVDSTHLDVLAVKDYESTNIRGVFLEIIDYKINFQLSVYFPDILKIIGCLFFIVTSSIMIVQLKHEEK